MFGHVMLHTDVDPVAGENETRYEAEITSHFDNGARENMVDSDAIEDNKASLLAPFEYIEGREPPLPTGLHLTYSAQQDHDRVHQPQDFRQFYPVEISDVEELPALEYHPLSIERDEIRLLALLPHHGDLESTVQCGFLTASLVHDHYCYIGIRNTRGYPYLTETIIINRQKKRVSKNVQVFLRNYRMETETHLLWIREICLNVEDPEEKLVHYNPHRESWIFSHSCRMLDMDDFMEEEAFKEAVRLAPQNPIRHKTWDKVTRDYANPEHYPRHFPIRLGQHQPERPPLPLAYLPLDIVAGEIRLVVLRPAENMSDRIEAYLAHEPLYGDASYECLSYTWGNMERDHRMLLNGQTFAITQNLDQALRGLRDSRTECVLWIDAICINQADTREKNRQVLRMYTVYENAQSVLIWLGFPDEETDIAMEFIQHVNSGRATEYLIKTPNGGYRLDFSLHLCRAFAALYRLLTRPYFTRLWVVQEIAMSSNPTAWCGTKRVSWFSLQKAAHMLQMHWKEYTHQHLFDNSLSPFPGHAFAQLNNIHRLNYHRYLQESGKRASLLHLALSTQITDCFDPRDKLYGLWDLASDTRYLNMKPGYSQPLVNVYVNFVKGHIEHHKSLDIICARQADTPGFPSWCPNWSQKPTMHTLIQRSLPPLGFDLSPDIPDLDRPIYRASRNTKPAYSFSFNDRTLTCAGTHFDTIAHIVISESPGNGLTLARWRDIARSHCHRNGTPLSESEADEEFWSMLTGEVLGGVLLDVSDDGGLQPIRLPPSASHFGEKIETMLRCRQFVVTQKGYIGLVPEGAAEVGMELVILLGCSVPVLLHKHEGHYHLRGSVYVQGWMDGEMLEGMGTDEEILEKVVTEPPFQIQ